MFLHNDLISTCSCLFYEVYSPRNVIFAVCLIVCACGMPVCAHASPVLCVQAPVDWERVSVAPVVGPDGKTTVPPEVIDSMKRNKIGLKGEPWEWWAVGVGAGCGALGGCEGLGWAVRVWGGL